MADTDTEDTQATEHEDQKADAGGADPAEGKAQQREEGEAAAGATGDSDQSEESQKAQEKEEESEKAKERIKEIEEDPPKNLEDWPDDAAKYETFGGPEGEHSYEEGPETKLGPSSLRHHEDGGVSIEGEPVDDADKYKGDPIPGGPTDPDASQDLTTEKIREKQGRELESEKDEDDPEGSSSESDSDSGSESDSDDSGDEEKAEQSS